MTLSELQLHCRRDIARSVSYSLNLPPLCMLAIRGNYLLVWGVGLAGAITFNLSLIVVAFAAHRMLREAQASPLLTKLPAYGFDRLPDITVDLEPQDREFIFRLLRQIGWDPRDLRVLANLDSSAATPSVASADDFLYLLLPAAFFSLWQRYPAIAEAVLAHEFGHIAQHDTNLYVDFRRYMKFIVRWFLPRLLLLTAVVCIAAIFVLPAVEKDEYQIFAGAVVSDAPDRWHDVLKFSKYAFGVTLAAMIAVLSLVGTTVLTLVLALLFRALNFRSEAVCDRIAVALTGHDGILMALNEFDNGTAKSGFHTPPLEWRREKLKKLLAHLDPLWSARSSDDNSNVTPVQVPGELSPRRDDFQTLRPRRSWLLARLFFWLVAGGFVAGQVYVYPRSEAIGFSEMSIEEDAWPWYRIEPMTMSANGRFLARIDKWSQSVRVIEAASGKSITSFPISTPHQRFVRLNESGRLLLVAPEVVHPELFDVAKQASLGELHSDSSLEEAAFLSIAGEQHLLLAERGGKIQLLRIESEGSMYKVAPVRTFEVPGRLVSVGIRADGRYFATVSDVESVVDPAQKLIVWSVDGGVLREALLPLSNTSKVALSSDGKYLSLNSLGGVAVIPIDNVERVDYLYNSRSKNLNMNGNVAFASNRNVIVSENDVENTDWRIALYGPPVPAGSRMTWPKQPLPLSLSTVDQVIWSQDGNLLLAVDLHGVAELVSVGQAKVVRKFEEDGPLQLVVTKDLRYAVTWHKSGLLRSWDLREGNGRKPVREYALGKPVCVGIGTGEQANSIVARHENGTSLLHMPDGEPISIADPGRCVGLDQERYSFRGAELEDHAMKWRIQLPTELWDAVVLAGPRFLDPHYVLLSRANDAVVTTTISPKFSKTQWLVWIVLAVMALAALTEFGLHLWRRHSTPF